MHSYRVAQVNFGTAVPKTRFIYSYLLTHYQDLVFYEQQQDTSLALHRVNPKRRQRLARKAIKKVFKGTKSQQTLQKQYSTKKHAVKVQPRPETLEIVNIAVTKTRRQQGIGQQMLIYAKSWAKANHYTVLEVGTGSTSLGQLYLYQKNGFRIYGVDTDFFIKHYAEPIFENKLRLRDMLRLRLEV